MYVRTFSLDLFKQDFFTKFQKITRILKIKLKLVINANLVFFFILVRESSQKSFELIDMRNTSNNTLVLAATTKRTIKCQTVFLSTF